MKLTQYHPLLLTAFASASMMCCVNAQTLPKGTEPVDDGTSLLVISDNNKEASTDIKFPTQAVESEVGITKPLRSDGLDGSLEDNPELTKLIAEAEEETPAGPDTQVTADQGIQIQVEKSTGKSGAMNQPGAVKVYSPWPAKPISPAPEGWKFAPPPSGVEPFKTTVKLSSGNTVDLSVTPFVLIPISDGRSAIRIAEPGYDPAQQYAQKETVGTMFQNSTTELENNEKQAASAIMRLQQLLSSLPQQQQ